MGNKKIIDQNNFSKIQTSWLSLLSEINFLSDENPASVNRFWNPDAINIPTINPTNYAWKTWQIFYQNENKNSK